MSTHFVKEQLQHYVNQKRPGVFALVGEWGVGKTHLWNEVASTFTISSSRPKYSYVSLFGIDSISAIEKELFINHVPIKQGSTPANIDTFIDSLKDTRVLKTKSVENGVKWLAWLYKIIGFIKSWFSRVPLIELVST